MFTRDQALAKFANPQPPEAGKRLPVARQAVRHADARPRHGEDREPDLQAEHVQRVPADRLRHDGALKCSNDPRVLTRADVQFLQHGRGGHRQCASSQVVDDRAEHDQADHPPSESSNLGHHDSGRWIRNSTV